MPHDRGKSKNGTMDGNLLTCSPFADSAQCRIYRDAEANRPPKRTALAFASFQLSGLAIRLGNTTRHSRCIAGVRHESYRLEFGETFHNCASAFAASDTARFFASKDDAAIAVPARCTIGVL